MSFNCSLEKHDKGYQFSNFDILVSPFTSCYAERHFELANSKTVSQTVRWGHRLIGFVESIPILGLIVSLIERIVVSFFKTNVPEKKATKLPEIKSVKPKIISTPHPTLLPIKKFPEDILSNVSTFLDVEDVNNLDFVNNVQKEFLWRGQAFRHGLKIQKNQKTENIVREIIAAEHLFEFFENVPVCTVKISSIRKGSENILQKAKEFREWMKSSQEISKLDVIKIEDKKIKVIPPEIALFKNLERLVLRKTEIKIIPEEIGELSNLYELHLSECKIKEVPVAILKLPKLMILALNGNKISKIPSQISQLKNLRELYVYENEIEEVCEGIFELKELLVLSLFNNKISKISDRLENLKKLANLWLHGNRLENVPLSITKLTGLVRLNLSNNLIENIPDSLFNLTHLSELKLSENKIKAIPKAIINFGKSLNYVIYYNLFFDRNLITDIPEEAWEFSNREKAGIYVGGNPLNEEILSTYPGIEDYTKYLEPKKYYQK